MAGTAQFTVDERDYVSASRAACRNQLRRGATWRKLGLFALLASGAVALFGGLSSGDWIDAAIIGALSGALGFAAGILCVGLGYALLPRRARRLYHQQRALHQTQSLSWEDDRLRWTAPSFTMDTPWEHYHRWSETGGEFLLYVNEQMPQFIPKAALGPARADDLRATLVAYGPPRS